jgi:microcystin-dependent protein
VDPFIGEIRLFAGTYAPRGWAHCHGQLLPIQQYQAVFSILGTTYGGDGRQSFALPDLRGRVPIHQGQGPGLTPRDLGESAGAEAVALLPAELPPHQHRLGVTRALATTTSPAGALVAEAEADITQTAAGGAGAAGGLVSPTGQGLPHENRPPTLVLNYIIALQGVFPSRG